MRISIQHEPMLMIWYFAEEQIVLAQDGENMSYKLSMIEDEYTQNTG